MPPKHSDTPSQSNLLSNVFSFVSREVECFVATAKGGKAPEFPKSSSSRVKLDSLPRGHGGVGVVRKGRPSGRDTGEDLTSSTRANAEHLAPGRTREDPINIVQDRDESGNGQARPQALATDSETIPVRFDDNPCIQNRPPSRSGSHTGLANASKHRPLRKNPSVTMPGSLFPRSPSLEPESTPYKDGGHQTPSSRDTRQPSYRNLREEAEKLVSTPNPFLVEGPPQSTGVISFPNDGPQSLNEFNPSPRSSPSPVSPRRRPSTPESPVGSDHARNQSATLKGKERARETVYDFLQGDTSQEIRVRGKEKELDEAREEQSRKEQELDPDASAYFEERERDKERIKSLEEEVARLKSQLAHQRHRNGSGPTPPPPPPPPPPPLPPPRRTLITPLTVSNIRKRSGPFTTAATESFLVSARAALRKQGPPVEAPINAANAPRTVKSTRTAHPTVKMPTEKMEAFLTEMKSVKLRKVSGVLAPPLIPDETERTALARSVRSSNGRDVLRDMVRRKSMSQLDPRTGEKRKRDITDAEFVVPTIPAKRIAKEGSGVSDTSSSSFTSSSSSIFSDRPTLTLADLHNRTWPSISTTDTDITTPSLCSDNENDPTSEVSPEDVLPPTPPRNRRSPDAFDFSTVEEDRLPEIIDVDAEPDDDDLSYVPPPLRDSTPVPPAMENAFARRVPVSPLPLAIPKKPRPPGRVRRAQPLPGTGLESKDHGSSNTSSRIPTLQRVAKKRKNNAFGTGQQPKQTSSGQIRVIDLTAHPSAHARRRRTLDHELRRAGDHLWHSDDFDDLESGTLFGVGTKDNHGGFLARGGGGGSPVFMGVGYVEGAEDLDDNRPSDD